MSEIVTLHDETGAAALIQTAFGFNCYSFRAVVDGQEHETLWSAPGFEDDKSRCGEKILEAIQMAWIEEVS